MQVAAKFGNIFSLRVGYDKIVLVSGYEWVKEVLVTQGDYFLDRAISPLFKEVFQGNGEYFLCQNYRPRLEPQPLYLNLNIYTQSLHYQVLQRPLNLLNYEATSQLAGKLFKMNFL